MVIYSIAEEQGPRFMVFGTIEEFENGLARLSRQVIAVTSKGWDGYDVNVNLGPLEFGGKLRADRSLPASSPNYVECKRRKAPTCES